jgi:hypothetical protein
MTMSNAQRQAAYRARHLFDEAAQGERLNVVLDASAKRMLERLAACYGVTQRALLQGLLSNAQHEALGRIYALPELPHGGDQYYDKCLPVSLTFVTA